MKIEKIAVIEVKIHEYHLDILYGVDSFKFSTKVFYHDVSFPELVERYSAPTINTVVSHIALFEGMKLCSLFPKYYDISAIAEGLPYKVIELFYKIYNNVFAQNLYENNITDYSGPEIIYQNTELIKAEPFLIQGDDATILAACGGGKDSILAMKMLQEAGLSFASLQYSHSVYGKADTQHNLIHRVLQHVSPVRKHQISIYDDFIESPFLNLYFPNYSGITVPETPISIFESLVLSMYWGYNYLILAHEKSANTGNFFSRELGKEVNHQWGKSFEAEKILNQYIQENIFANIHYCSLLQPIYDFRIFKNLSKYPEVLPDIHSCNIKKPWCKKCPKCAYVWLGLMAFFDFQAVDAVFQSNLFDDDDLLPIYRQMLGLSEHTPFECIGEIDETRLAMKKCLEKGLRGKAIDIFKDEVLSDTSINWEQIHQKYDRIYETEHAIPAWIFSVTRDKF